MEELGSQGQVSNRRLGIYYAVLALLAVVGLAVSLSIGGGEHAQRPIAGGYDVSAGDGCLGSQFELIQSGKFVSLQSTASRPSGKLDFDRGHLTGTVHCVNGRSGPIDATVGHGSFAGSVAGTHAQALLRHDPPDPGSPRPLVPGAVAGSYKLAPSSLCLGGRISLGGPSKALVLKAAGRPAGTVSYAHGMLAGTLACSYGGQRRLQGSASGRQLDLKLLPLATGASPAVAPGGAPGPATAPVEHVTATEQRSAGDTVASFFIAVVVVMLAARLVGILVSRIGQPRVMGEVLAGILLGPTLLGLIAPEVQNALFPSDIVPYIGVAANLGLIFYMFLIGLELDPRQLRSNLKLAVAISNTGIAVPMVIGVAVAVPLYKTLGPDKHFVAFALFMGVAMSITAFPVLARIVVERRMLKRPLGAVALASAAVDDVTAWFLIALASAFAVAGGGSEVIVTVLEAVAFCVVMMLLVRPVLARASTAYDEMGRLPGSWVTAIFGGVLLAAYVTESIGIAVIFGAFVMGLAMPRHAGLTEDVTHRLEDFIVTVLLPLFFAYTGLRTNMRLLDRPELIVITLVLVAVAILGKYGGTIVAARVMGLGWRASAVLGALMNTRGLTELIVLNLALEMGVISSALFAALVIMALVTTFMAGPVLRLLDPRNEFGEPVEEELASARRQTTAEIGFAMPERSILVAPQTSAALAQLLAIGEPLARTEPRRELILARVVRPPRAAGVRGGLQTEGRLLAEATEEVGRDRERLLAAGIAARAVAFTASEPGRDLARLAESEEVDLLLIDGRRPLLGAGVPREEVGSVLRRAPCDVAVLVAREDVALALGASTSILVPFGGAEHDWAALELGAWLSSATAAPLKLLGAAGDTDERDPSRMLADASLMIQQFAGVAAQPLIAERGKDGIIRAAAGAGLIVCGLSERWRQEGLGETRAAIARSAPAPTIFVRRGIRAGALAPRDDLTRFSWSSPALTSGPPQLS